jgi:hypothetical protein
MAIDWTCPYCGRDATIQDANRSTSLTRIGEFLHNNKHGTFGLNVRAVSCPNPKCREVVLSCSMVQVIDAINLSPRYRPGQILHTWPLLPESLAKPQPAFIPKPIVDAYKQACRIVSLSPEASATMSRRCIQGMIRDFWKVKKRTLWLEIEAIKTKVDKETWKAIHAVREFGNIGAHMQKNIDLLVEVDPGEAEMLIKLIELLFRQWYVRRYDDEERVAAVVALGAAKKKQVDAKKQAALPAAAPPLQIEGPKD